MGLILLEKLIRVDVRILIVEANNSTDMYQIWAHMIHKGTSIDIRWERPVNSMLNQTLLEVWVSFGNSPHLL